MDIRDSYIGQVVAGATFADVGGLWGTVNEKVSVAHKRGARRVAMLDISPPDSPLWQLFHQRMAQEGVSDYHCATMDVASPSVTSTVEPFDVIHCSGVLYHHPNPMLLLRNLRALARQHVVLTSAIAQASVTNATGTYTMPDSAVLFVPALTTSEREILGEYWRSFGVAADGLTNECAFNPDDFGPWWWLPTAGGLLAMCRAAGFTIVDHSLTWNNNALVTLLTP
jgi:2-polyprenyl-3-methyl-5-hydroxy-6-metoxy-1,4-benzoquinol methylase